MKGLKAQGDKRNQVFLSSISDKFGAQIYSESRSVCEGVLKKNASQSSLLESLSQAGGSSQLGNLKNTDAFSKNHGKQNAGERKPTIDAFSRNIQLDNMNGSLFLSSLGSNNGRRQSLQGTDICSIGKSKPKDRKIQALIQSNVPKMTRDKQYYVQKLIECQNALRAKDKKLKTLEKTEKQLRQQFDQISASELMYKTQLKCFQKNQSSKISQIGDLQYKVTQLQSSLKAKQTAWLGTKSSLQFEVTSLKQKIQAQTIEKKSVQRKLVEEINKTSSLLEIQQLYSESKTLNSELETKNAELSLKLSTLEKQCFGKLSEIQYKQDDHNIKYLTLQNKVISLQKQNKQLVYQYQQYKINKQKELQTYILTQKKLQMEIETLTGSLNQKFEQGESNVNKLKASHDHLKFQNLQLKKFVENSQTQQVEIQGILKLRNIELENELKQVRQSATSDKQSSMKILGQLRTQVNNYRVKVSELQNERQKTQESLKKVDYSTSIQIKQLQEKLQISNQKNSQLLEFKDRFNSLTSFTTAQSQQIERNMQINESNKEKICELQATNKVMITQISQMRPMIKILNNLYQYLESIEIQHKESESVLEFIQVFETFNSILNKTYTFWTPLLQPKQTKSSYQKPCLAILEAIDIQQSQGWETKVISNITILKECEKQFKQLSTKLKEKTKYFETRLHVCKEQDQRKTLVISELKSNIKLLEKSLNDASDKLLKCTTLLEQSNQKVIVGEARLADAKNQLNIMYGQLKSQNNAIAEKNLSVQNQLRDLLAKHYEGFYDEIVQRSQQDLLRLDVFLIKAFLNTTIEINHKVKQVIPTSPYMQQLLIQRDGILGQIRQYYKELVQPEIAQLLAHHKPLKGNRFQ